MQTPSGASVAVPRELIGVGQVACLLAVATIEGQETPYWFIEQLAGLPPTPRGRWGELVRRLSGQVTPLSHYLLKTCQTLAICESDLQEVPLRNGECKWLTSRLDDMISFTEQVLTTANREASRIHIMGLLIDLVQLIGTTLLHILAERTPTESIRELQEAMRGVGALYQALSYASHEQRQVVSQELRLLAPLLSALRLGLSEATATQAQTPRAAPGILSAGLAPTGSSTAGSLSVGLPSTNS